MKYIWKQLKLIDHLSMELDIDQNVFVSRLKDIVDEGDIDFPTNSSKLSSSNKKPYKGSVTLDSFTLREQSQFLGMLSSAKAIGKYQQDKNVLKIEVEIHGFAGTVLTFYPVIFLLFFIASLENSISNGRLSPSEISFLILEIILFMPFLLIFYFLIKRGVSKLRCDLERTFFYISN